ncbi:MAG: SPASM domain-containing protein [Holosporaceae bacterium]|jgi:radical SAM protein with 4Fe4S-binding SPASM domain|nr:SPASM domain-containing protein [Holosporaceae bacterium]
MLKLITESELGICSVSMNADAHEIETKFLCGLKSLIVLKPDYTVFGVITFEDFVDKGYYQSDLTAESMSSPLDKTIELKYDSISFRDIDISYSSRIFVITDAKGKVRAFLVDMEENARPVDHALKSLITCEVDYRHEHFFASPAMGADSKKKLFVDSMHSIQMETSSFCNRRCPYCVLSVYNRGQSFIPMDKIVYNRLMNELNEIDYKGILDFHLFNEPLYERDYIVKLMKKTRQCLPCARFRLVSNGDYLNGDFLDEICETGMGEFIITRQFNETWDIETQDASIKKFIDDLSLEIISFRADVNDIKYQVAYKKNREVKFTVQSTNFPLIGNDRGVLKNVAKHIKNGGCNRPFNHFSVTYDGDVFPCCVMSPTLKGYSIGNIKSASIFDIFASEKACGFRRSAFRGFTLPGCCKNCYSDTVYTKDAARRDYIARIAKFAINS